MLEIAQRLTFALQASLLDLQHEHIARPPVLDRAPGISQAFLGYLDLGEKHQVVPPGQLSNRLLDNCRLGPRPATGRALARRRWVARTIADTFGWDGSARTSPG